MDGIQMMAINYIHEWEWEQLRTLPGSDEDEELLPGSDEELLFEQYLSILREGEDLRDMVRMGMVAEALLGLSLRTY